MKPFPAPQFTRNTPLRRSTIALSRAPSICRKLVVADRRHRTPAAAAAPVILYDAACGSIGGQSALPLDYSKHSLS